MIARTSSLCRFCETYIVADRDAITKRPNAKGREVWGHVDCDYAANLTEVEHAEAYEDHINNLRAVMAREAEWAEGLRADYAARGFAAVKDAEHAYERAVTNTQYATLDYMGEYGRIAETLSRTRRALDLLYAFAGVHEDAAEGNIFGINERVQERRAFLNSPS